MSITTNFSACRFGDGGEKADFSLLALSKMRRLVLSYSPLIIMSITTCFSACWVLTECGRTGISIWLSLLFMSITNSFLLLLL
jgi:hypothetical protein